MVEIPKYENYSLLELYQVLNSIRADRVPDVYEALQSEIASRKPSSAMELEDCYFALDKDRNPEYADKLVEQINALGGTPALQPEAITEENKYRTFWRRFWAHFFDGFVVGVPLGLLVFGLQNSGLTTDQAAPYIDQITQFAGLAYYIAMHAAFGQTVGKMITGVRVLHKSEQAGVSIGQAIMRDIVPVCFFVASLGYLAVIGVPMGATGGSGVSAVIVYPTAFAAIAWWVAEMVTMLFNAKRRAVHDFIARTVVVRVQ